MRRLAAAIDSNDIVSSSSREQQQHSAVYRCNGAFLAFFQTTHIWGNLVSSILLSHDVTIQHAGADKAGSLLVVQEYEEIYSAADGTGAYCGTYDRCDSLQPVTSLTTVNSSGTCRFSWFRRSFNHISTRPSVTLSVLLYITKLNRPLIIIIIIIKIFV